MGQHFASLKEFIIMVDSDKQSQEEYPVSVQCSSVGMLDRSESNDILIKENNGNIPTVNTNVTEEKEKLEADTDNQQLNLDLHNHNSRFESIYSEPNEGQGPKKSCSNGNFITTEQESLKQSETCCTSGSSNTSSSSEDSPLNPAFRRSSKTLSFGSRKGNLSNSNFFKSLYNICVFARIT